MNFIEILSGLLTPMIAIIAAYIAFQQYRSNKKQGKLKLELDTVNSQLEKNRLKLEELFPSLENHTTISLQKYTTLMQG